MFSFFMKSVETGDIFARHLSSRSEKTPPAFFTFSCGFGSAILAGLASRIPFSMLLAFSRPDLTESGKRHFLLLRRRIPATPA